MPKIWPEWSVGGWPVGLIQIFLSDFTTSDKQYRESCCSYSMLTILYRSRWEKSLSSFESWKIAFFFNYLHHFRSEKVTIYKMASKSQTELKITFPAFQWAEDGRCWGNGSDFTSNPVRWGLISSKLRILQSISEHISWLTLHAPV